MYLNSSAAGVVEPDDRGPDQHCLVHHFADLFSVGHGQGSAEHREVLAEHVGPAAINQPVTGNNGVARNFFFLHAEVGAGVLHEHVVLDKAPGVEQHVYTLSSGQLTLLVLSINPFLST